jgi:hypothetical protein
LGTIQFLINIDVYRNESDASASGQRKVASANHGLAAECCSVTDH